MLTLGVFAICTQALAQKTVTGRVTDDKGAPVSNASVVVKGSSLGTVTNNEGFIAFLFPRPAKPWCFLQ
jgi:hypothetical protein